MLVNISVIIHHWKVFKKKFTVKISSYSFRTTHEEGN